MASPLPLILIEVVLVFGGVLAFGWWQLRSVRRDREQARRRPPGPPEGAGPAEAKSDTSRNGADERGP